MRQFLLLLLLPVLCISCSSSEAPEVAEQVTSTPQNNALELVDVRIYEDGDLRINGEIISESALDSNLDALSFSESTKVRVTSSDEVYTGLVHRTMREFAQRGLSVTYNMMTKKEFEVFESTLIVDVLNNGKIMLDGNLLYPEDLTIALEQSTKGITVKLNIAEKVTFGMVADVQKILKKNHPLKISYSKIRT